MLTGAPSGHQVLNLGCGRLPKIAAVMLVSDAVLDTAFDPDTMSACKSAELEAVVRNQLQLLDDTNSPKFGGGRQHEAWQHVERAAVNRAAGGGAAGGDKLASEPKSAAPVAAARGSGWFSRPGGAECGSEDRHLEDSHLDARRSLGADARASGWLGGSWTIIPSLPRMPRLMSGFIGIQLPWESPSSPQTPETRSADAHWPPPGGGEAKCDSQDRHKVPGTHDGQAPGNWLETSADKRQPSCSQSAGEYV